MRFVKLYEVQNQTTISLSDNISIVGFWFFFLIREWNIEVNLFSFSFTPISLKKQEKCHNKGIRKERWKCVGSFTAGIRQILRLIVQSIPLLSLAFPHGPSWLQKEPNYL